MYFPEFSAALFPEESLGNLKFLSQIVNSLHVCNRYGARCKVLKIKASEAIVISHASIIFRLQWELVLYFVYNRFAPSELSSLFSLLWVLP
jgi:hypothetical protein